MNASKSVILPLLFIFPLFAILTTAQPFGMLMATTNGQEEEDDNDDDNNADASAAVGQGAGQGIATGEPDPTNTADYCATNPEDDICPPPQPGPPGPGPGPGPVIGQSNRATSEQTGGIGAGDIIQRAQGGVTEQLCSTIGGIGNRQCQQQAEQGAIQDCTAIAGLGKANCVQSENPDGSGTCLTANGRPYICETATGRSLSGSGQAGQ